MKRAMKWLKKLLTGRKDGDKDHKENHAASAGASGLPREKKRWSFVKQRKSGADGGSGRWPLVAGAAGAADLSQVRPCHCGEEAAAVVIQKAFRGYLARKALRALRSLVKLQALVRGYLVRRQTATTLHRLQAIVRLQASSHSVKKAYSWKSMEQERKIAQARINPPALPAHRRRLSDGADSNFERSPRIVEMDTCQLRSRSSRMTSRYASDSSDSPPAVAPPSPSPLPSKQPSRLSLRRCQEYEPRRSKTAHSTPRLGPVPSYDLPAKSAGAAADGLTRRLSHREGSPRYMAETTSSVAKMRCQSEPRQRPGAHTEGPAEPRPSLTRAGSRKSCSVVVQDSFSFKSSELSRMDRSEVSDEVTIDFYLDRLW